MTTSTAEGSSVSAERTENEVVIRVPTLGRLLRACMPEEAVQHLYRAQREQLLAMRAVLDAAIERLEDTEGTKRIRRTEIRVE
jgi:hypothetical protein